MGFSGWDVVDIHIVDTDAQSYHDCTPLAVLCSAEHSKKQKYSQPCQDRRATFNPFLQGCWMLDVGWYDNVKICLMPFCFTKSANSTLIKTDPLSDTMVWESP